MEPLYPLVDAEARRIKGGCLSELSEECLVDVGVLFSSENGGFEILPAGCVGLLSFPVRGGVILEQYLFDCF